MIEITVTNRANETKPLVIQDLPDGEFVGVVIADQIARVRIDELERAISACKHS